MAKKKSKKKDQSAESQNNGLLGGNLNGIAIALLTTLVTEIVQQVLDRLFSTGDSTGKQPNLAGAASHSDRAEMDSPKLDLDREKELEKSPATTAASLANDRISQTRPLMQDVLKTIRTTVQEAAPRLNEAIAVLQASSNDPKQAVATLVRDAVAGTKETLDTAAVLPNVSSWLSDTLTATQTAIDSISTNSEEEPEKKHKKKKGKKKKGKKSKK